MFWACEGCEDVGQLRVRGEVERLELCGRWHDISRQERHGQAFPAEGGAQGQKRKCVGVQDPGSLTQLGNAGSLGVCRVNGGRWAWEFVCDVKGLI